MEAAELYSVHDLDLLHWSSLWCGKLAEVEVYTRQVIKLNVSIQKAFHIYALK